MNAAVHGVARRLQLAQVVAARRRALVAEEVARVEEAVQAAQQHLQLEEDLLAARDGDGADPTFALGQVLGAHPLRVAHELEEEVLDERLSLQGPLSQNSAPCGA